MKVLTAEKARPTSGGSRDRRLGQLPRAPREGGTKEGRAKSKGKFQQVLPLCLVCRSVIYLLFNFFTDNSGLAVNDIRSKMAVAGPGNECSRERIVFRTKVPGNERSRECSKERMVPRTKVPSWERMFQGTNSLGNECSWYPAHLHFTDDI